MGRETVLTSVLWVEGQFPVFKSVRGQENGPLPPVNKDIESLGSALNRTYQGIPWKLTHLAQVLGWLE